MQPIATSRFDLADLPTCERFAVWKDSIAVLFDVSLETPEAESDFTSRLTTCQIGSILLANSVSKAQHFRRTRQRICRDDMDHLLVQVYRKGRNRGRCGKVSLDVRPGDLMFLDLGQTLETHTDDYDNLTLVLPRQVVESCCPDPARLHGQIIRGDSVSGQLLRSHIEHVWHNLARVTEPEVAGMVTGLSTLVSAYFGALPDLDTLPDIQSARLDIIKDYIASHLASPDLTPDKLASRFYMSRATLYRLFAPCGGLAAYVREQRLEKAMVLLGHPACRQRYIADIAASVGFHDEAHFCRLFRSTFGMTPGEARSACLMDETPFRSRLSASSPDRSWEQWLRGL